MSYLIVEFIDDSSVDVVPHTWINDTHDICLWPLYKSNKLVNAVKKMEHPQESWLQCKIRILHTFESYDAARVKLGQAEETSALETDKEESSTKRSCRKRRPVLLSDSESSPEKAVTVGVQKNFKHDLMPMPQVPAQLMTGNLDNSLSNEYPVCGKSTVTPRKRRADDCQVEDSDVTPVRMGSSNHGKADTPRKDQNSSSHLQRSTTVKLVPATKTTVTRDQIWQKINMIEVHLRQQTRLLQGLQVAVQSRGMSVDDTTLPDGINLPNKTLSELLDMEKKIQSTENFQKMVNFLGTTGGKDVADTTRRILRQIMTTSVACRMNFLGRGKKTGISDMKVLQLVIGAVRRNQRLARVTRSEIETVVKLWLRYAGDRSGGRATRVKGSAQTVESDYSD